MIRVLVLSTAVWLCAVGVSLADATIPTKDIPGSADSEIVGRLAGSFIVDYVDRDFDEATFPLSELKPIKGKKWGNNNQLFQPDGSKTVEGRRTRIVYLDRADSSTLTNESQLTDNAGIFQNIPVIGDGNQVVVNVAITVNMNTVAISDSAGASILVNQTLDFGGTISAFESP